MLLASHGLRRDEIERDTVIYCMDGKVDGWMDG
jgi:hypothetical protein